VKAMIVFLDIFILENGYYIRTTQELLGHASVRITHGLFRVLCLVGIVAVRWLLKSRKLSKYTTIARATKGSALKNMYVKKNWLDNLGRH
jgi:hypothetical protein